MSHRIQVACRDLRAAIARTLRAIGPAASTSAASASAAAATVPATEPAAASTAAVVEQEIYAQEHGIQADVPDDLPCIPAAAATTAILAKQRRFESVRFGRTNNHWVRQSRRNIEAPTAKCSHVRCDGW